MGEEYHFLGDLTKFKEMLISRLRANWGTYEKEEFGMIRAGPATGTPRFFIQIQHHIVDIDTLGGIATV